MAGMGDPATEPVSASPDVQPIRVAWVAGEETFGRLRRVLQPLAVGLLDEMVELAVLCPAGGCGELEAVPTDVVPYSAPRWWPLGGGPIDSLAAELKKRNVDVLHGLDGSAARLTCDLARAASLPYVLSSYSLEDTKLLADAGRNAAAVLAASEPLRNALIGQAVCAGDRVRLMRPGVYHVRRPTCFNEPGHSTAVVAGGPLTEAGPFEAVLACFAELSARQYDCVYFLIGDGPAERPLRKRAAQLGLREELTFVTGQPMAELPGIFKAADIYISPTTYASIDMRSLLAMASGVPVLAAGPGGVSDFLRHGETATFFTQADAAELTVKLAALLRDRPGARGLAEGAIEYVRDHHSPAVNVTGLGHIYRQTVAEGD